MSFTVPLQMLSMGSLPDGQSEVQIENKMGQKVFSSEVAMTSLMTPNMMNVHTFLNPVMQNF